MAVNTGLGLTISSDAVVIEWGGTSSGLTFSVGNTLGVNVDGNTVIINNDGKLEVSVEGFKSEPVYQITNSATQSPPNANGFNTTIALSSTPSQYSRINVFVNGQQQRLGDGVTATDCYFAATASINTAKELSDLTSGDVLVWNGVIAGFRISGSDQVDIIYEA